MDNFPHDHWRRTGINSMGASISTTSGRGRKKRYTYMYNFGAGQENCGCKCTHCTHKFGAIAYNPSLQIFTSIVNFRIFSFMQNCYTTDTETFHCYTSVENIHFFNISKLIKTLNWILLFPTTLMKWHFKWWCHNFGFAWFKVISLNSTLLILRRQRNSWMIRHRLYYFDLW